VTEIGFKTTFPNLTLTSSLSVPKFVPERVNFWPPLVEPEAEEKLSSLISAIT